MSPKWSPKAPQEASRASKLNSKSDLDLNLIFDAFWSDLGKWTNKSLKNLSWASLGAPGTQEVAQRPFGVYFGAILEPILERCWNTFATESIALRAIRLDQPGFEPGTFGSTLLLRRCLNH